MAKSKARFLAELLGSTGLVKKSKSELAGADEILDLDTLPTIPNSKLQNSSISIAGHSTALGGSVSLNTGDISEHTNYPYFTNARARGAVSVSGDLAYNSTTGVFSFTERTDAEVRGLVSATGSLSYNSSTGVMSFTMPAQNTSNITEGTNLYFTNARADARIAAASTSDLSEGSNLYFTNARARSAISATGSLSYNSTTGVFSFTERTDAEVRGLVSASGNLSYNSSTGAFSYTTPTTIASLSNHDTADLAEGTNLYFTNARADARIAAASTSDLSEGSNLYFTNARARSAISATGSLSYNSTTGVFSYTTPTTIASLSNHDTADLAEGTNLYFTNARADARIAAASTSDLSEGTNLYYTDARADARVALIVDSAPGTLNTLNELAAALGDDANFSTTVTNSIATKLPLAGGTLTGTLAMGANAITSTGTISSGGITTVGASVFNSYSASDPDSTSRTNYPAGNMFTHYSQANGVSIIGGQGSYSGTSLTIGEETGRSANFNFIRGISDTNGTPAEEFSINGVGDAVFAGTISSGAITSTGQSFLGNTTAITGTSTNATTNVSYLGFYESDKTTRQGYIGYGSSGNTSLYITNDVSGSNVIFRIQSNTRVTFGVNDAIFDSNINIASGHTLQVGGTTVIDSSRNLTNIGTISSGAITSSGNIVAGTSTNYLRAKSLRLNNGEIDDADFAYAYQLIVDANDSSSNMSNKGDFSGSYPYGIYMLGDNALTTKTIGSGLVGIWNTTNFKKEHIDYLVGLKDSGVTTVEYDYLDGVTSNIQTQLDARLPLSGGTLTGTLAMGANAITSTGTISSGAITATSLTTSGDIQVNGNQVRLAASQARVKYSVWTGDTYGIGMQTGYTFGAINNEYVMSFQMNNDSDRGFWWGDASHTNAQGAMALSTDGYLTVARGMRLGFGESDTTHPVAGLQVSGTISSGAITSTGTSVFDRIQTGLGTVASPAVKVGDNDSGFYDSGANMIGVSLGGVLEYDFQPTQFDMKANNLIGVGTISSGAITITDDGADLIINSDDQELVLLGNRGSTGTNLDAGYLRMKSQGVNKIILDTEGVSSLLGGGLTVGGAITVNQNGDALNLRSTINGQLVRITFSSHVPTAQIGHIEYTHSNSASYGSGEAFIISGTESTRTILADGKLMFKEGLYIKPASGTGAGTQVIDSSRNLTNIGTISSGAITSSGNVSLNQADGFVYLNNQGTGNAGIYVRGITSSSTLRSHSTNNFRWEVTGSQKMELDSSGILNAVGGYKVNGTSVIDSSRNIFAHQYYYLDTKIMAQGTDSYLRINQSGQFGSGCWFGSSQILNGSSRYIATGSNGGTTNARVYMYGGTYNATNVIALDGSDGRIKGSYYTVGGTTVIDSSRNLTNIGTITSTAVNQPNAQKITVSDTDPLTSRNGLYIDHNVTGNTALTTDVSKRGIFVDLDVTSTGGNTTDELRAYGIVSDVRGTGDSDLRYGIYSYSETQHAAGTVSANYGIFAQAVSDDTGSGHTGSNYGGQFLAYGYGSGTGGTTSHTGVYSKVLLTTANDKNTASTTGVYSEIEIDDPGQAQTLSTAYVVRAEFDNDSAGNVTINNGYLYYGNYAGTVPTTAWGVYIVDAVPNYFAGSIIAASADISGSVAIGSEIVLAESTDRADLLQITGTTSTWAGIQIRNSSSEGRWSFMTDGSMAGIYDDENNDWYMQFNELGATGIFHNSAQKLITTTGGVTVTGLLSSTTVTASGLITGDRFLSAVGTAASPAFQVGDTNTGFFDSGANTIGVACNGAHEFNFTAATLDMKGNTITNGGNITLYSSATDARYLHLPRGGGITLYGDASVHHGIFSRNSSNNATDDILISSYGAVYFDLDSNSNNTSAANFEITKHNGTAPIFKVDGENSNVTLYNDLYIPDQIIHSGDTDTYMQFHAADQWRVVTGGAERLEVNNSAVTIPGTLNVRGAIDLADSDFLRFGSGDDVEFFCDGVHMYMDLNGGIGNFYIRDGTTTRYTFNDNGSFTATGNITAYSDSRVKAEFKPITNALYKVQQLNGTTYIRTDMDDDNKRYAGLISQDVQAVLPEAVTEIDDHLALDYNGTIALLVEAIKELKTEIDSHKALIKKLMEK